MALDKQRILNELGSVMNQLQSADCGCMDKLFTNPGRTSSIAENHIGNNYGGCRHGCCHSHGYGYHHGSYNSPCAGGPAMNSNHMGIGNCNPPKLYADTYNYLNQNLMQPIVKDVYNDLKNLTSENAVANNPMAGQMGLSNMNSITGDMSHPSQSISNPISTCGLGSNKIQDMSSTPGMMRNIASMGPQIVNMMTNDGKSKPFNIDQAQGGVLTTPMAIDAPNSPYGQVGVTPLNQSINNNQAQLNALETPHVTQVYSNLQPHGQSIKNVYGGDTRVNNSHLNSLKTNMSQSNENTLMGNMNSNPVVAQQINAAENNPHGSHAPAVAKFNEMFPGVMKGLGGNLGFDPMAIAIQMNPANQKKVAMDTMQKIMNGANVNNDLGADSRAKPAVARFPQIPSSQAQHMSAALSGQKEQTKSQIISNQHLTTQQNHAAVPENCNLNAQECLEYSQRPGEKFIPSCKTQDIINPRQSIRHMPNNLRFNHIEQSLDTTHKVSPPQAIIKEPILPVDSSKNTVSPSLTKMKFVEYNTLGQPVEMLPAKLYHTYEPNFSQTLSPQPPLTRNREDIIKYSNVKSTVSKTSLMANKPIGKVPSRNQLQHIYNQYKGSQSFTHQNIPTPTQGVTHSEGHIPANHGTSNTQRGPLEEQIGDVVANNTLPAMQKMDQVMGHIGDAPMGKPPSQDEPVKAATMISKLRNGLQDMVYTSYPTSAAWSFHGNNRAPYYPGRRSVHRT